MRTAVLAGGVVAVLACAAWAVLARSGEDRVVAAAAAVLVAVAVGCGLAARRRLTADDDGFTLRGPGGARRFEWRHVVAVQSPTRRRLGLSSTSVEIDLDDDGLILLSRTELGADPGTVAAALRRRWLAAGSGRRLPPGQQGRK
ncbi:PH domain-containing protein [Nakamurella endophytica]|uniref:Low molecular weight protein antigen 6 PH domain-containing protein n=1 Tax=Nakamurella endophytica TaxID=1748367 RepID=A0A917WG37_9ACTN|nr:PH domain-containing protein [Nakamurella endophytica]GGM00109.1 hypothetical protein GCM10011594_20220 [Nakamurella endophytica]